MKTKSLWHLSATSSALLEEDLEPAGDNFLEIESLFSLVSTGTERLVATGGVPPALFSQMRVPHQGGEFSFPIKYGYSLVGKVATQGHPLSGKIVHLMHPHQERCFAAEADLFLIPEGIPPQRAALSSNLGTAVTAIWDSGASVGERVAVVGFGIIGSLVARLLSLMPAVEVVVFEKMEARREAASRLGFQLAQSPVCTASADRTRTVQAFDLAFHTSGTAEGLQQCIEMVGMEGKVVELSWYGLKEVQVSLGGSFHIGRKQVISSQVSHIPANRSARWDRQRRKTAVFELLKNPVWDEHIGKVMPFEEAQKLFEQLRVGTFSELSCLLSYR